MGVSPPKHLGLPLGCRLDSGKASTQSRCFRLGLKSRTSQTGWRCLWGPLLPLPLAKYPFPPTPLCLLATQHRHCCLPRHTLCLAHPCNLGPEPLAPLLPTNFYLPRLQRCPPALDPFAPTCHTAQVPLTALGSFTLEAQGWWGWWPCKLWVAVHPAAPRSTPAWMVQVHGPGMLSDPHLATSLKGGQGKTPAITGLWALSPTLASCPSPGQQAAVGSMVPTLS